jgi:DNA repair exonuclease SbcCD ATPase subunit
MAEQEEKKRRGYWDIVITVILVAVLVQAVNTYFKTKSDKIYNVEIEKARDEVAVLEHDLQQRADEITKLGGNVKDLQDAIQQLEVEKKNLVTKGVYTSKQMGDLKDKVEGYRELLEMKDKEITRLKDVNQQLVTENTTLKTKKNELNAALTQEQQNRQQLESKVAVAQRLKAENIKVLAINSRGKIKESEFKARFINKVRVEFNIADNPIAPIEGKDIMIRIIGPDDNVLFDVAKGGGTFIIDGKEEFFTLKQQILFDNSRQKLSYDYEKGSEYEPGRYVVKLYAGDYQIGEQAFLIK